MKPAERNSSVGNAGPYRFAGYDLIKRLGSGGTGEVWSALARSQFGSQAVAIKVINPELSRNETFERCFIADGRSAMRLSSANIVPAFELGRYAGLLYMVMARIDGVDLDHFCGKLVSHLGALPLPVAAYIVGEILSALHVAHEAMREGQPDGLVHGDVKPQNVLISSTGDVRLTDFGGAKPIAELGRRGLPIVGTWSYMAPEQARGSMCVQSDLFAVGVILHELLAGARFRRKSRGGRSLQNMAIAYHRVPPLDRPVPAELESLRRRLLHPEPQQRIQSAAEAMSELSRWDGYRFSRPRMVQLYERVIGMRSSGFSAAHDVARPSFVEQRMSKMTPAAATDTEVLCRRGDSLLDSDDDEVDTVVWDGEPDQASTGEPPEVAIAAPAPRARDWGRRNVHRIAKTVVVSTGAPLPATRTDTAPVDPRRVEQLRRGIVTPSAAESEADAPVLWGQSRPPIEHEPSNATRTDTAPVDPKRVEQLRRGIATPTAVEPEADAPVPWGQPLPSVDQAPPASEPSPAPEPKSPPAPHPVDAPGSAPTPIVTAPGPSPVPTVAPALASERVAAPWFPRPPRPVLLVALGIASILIGALIALLLDW